MRARKALDRVFEEGGAKETCKPAFRERSLHVIVYGPGSRTDHSQMSRSPPTLRSSAILSPYSDTLHIR